MDSKFKSSSFNGNFVFVFEINTLVNIYDQNKIEHYITSTTPIDVSVNYISEDDQKLIAEMFKNIKELNKHNKIVIISARSESEIKEYFKQYPQISFDVIKSYEMPKNKAKVLNTYKNETYRNSCVIYFESDSTGVKSLLHMYKNDLTHIYFPTQSMFIYLTNDVQNVNTLVGFIIKEIKNIVVWRDAEGKINSNFSDNSQKCINIYQKHIIDFKKFHYYKAVLDGNDKLQELKNENDIPDRNNIFVCSNGHIQTGGSLNYQKYIMNKYMYLK